MLIEHIEQKKKEAKDYTNNEKKKNRALKHLQTQERLDGPVFPKSLSQNLLITSDNLVPFIFSPNASPNENEKKLTRAKRIRRVEERKE